jgi:hypothetical protein
MRSPHLVLTAAVRGVFGRLGRGSTRSVSLEGRAYRDAKATPFDRCHIEGCGARATRFAIGADGGDIAVCTRCGEELEAILGIASTSATPED